MKQLIDHFSTYTQLGYMNYNNFTNAILKLNQSADPKLLFHIFDLDGDSKIDFFECMTGIALLCKGTLKDKLKSLHSLYDINKDNVLSRAEMYQFFRAVIRGTHCLSHINDNHQNDAIFNHQSCVELVNTCFDVADISGDNVLSFDEFFRWYNSEDRLDLLWFQLLDLTSYDEAEEDVSENNHNVIEFTESDETIYSSSRFFKDIFTNPFATKSYASKFATLSGCSNILLPQLIGFFVDYSSESNDETSVFYTPYDDSAVTNELSRLRVARGAITAAITNLLTQYRNSSVFGAARNSSYDSVEHEGMVLVIIDRMMDFFHTDEENCITFPEWIIALSVLANGSIEDKLSFIFALFCRKNPADDTNSNGYLTRPQFMSLNMSLSFVLIALSSFSFNSEWVEHVQKSRRIARRMVLEGLEDLFENANLKYIDKVSFEEFYIWRSANPETFSWLKLIPSVYVDTEEVGFDLDSNVDNEDNYLSNPEFVNRFLPPYSPSYNSPVRPPSTPLVKSSVSKNSVSVAASSPYFPRVPPTTPFDLKKSKKASAKIKLAKDSYIKSSLINRLQDYAEDDIKEKNLDSLVNRLQEYIEDDYNEKNSESQENLIDRLQDYVVDDALSKRLSDKSSSNLKATQAKSSTNVTPKKLPFIEEESEPESSVHSEAEESVQADAGMNLDVTEADIIRLKNLSTVSNLNEIKLVDLVSKLEPFNVNEEEIEFQDFQSFIDTFIKDDDDSLTPTTSSFVKSFSSYGNENASAKEYLVACFRRLFESFLPYGLVKNIGGEESLSSAWLSSSASVARPDSRVCVNEMIFALALYCGGSRSEKIMSFFELYDDIELELTYSELLTLLLSVLRSVNAFSLQGIKLNRGVKNQLEIQASINAAETCFNNLSLENSDKINFPDFIDWIDTFGDKVAPWMLLLSLNE